jgi:hypothetical protein
MISRKTTKTLAELYNNNFLKSHGKTTYGKYIFTLDKNKLYDYLYERDYEVWFLIAVRNLHDDERSLKEFIMELHTGISLYNATQSWPDEQRIKLGQRLLHDLAEDILISYKPKESNSSFINPTDKMYLKLKAELELNGYIFLDDKLFFSEAAVLDTETEQGYLEKLIIKLQLQNQELIKHHLNLSEKHYIDGNWSDSISNSRCFLEAVLLEIVAEHHKITGTDFDRDRYSDHAYEVRDYLEKKGLLAKKEKEALAKIYGLLSETGSHPFMAEKDQARLLRYLSFTFAQFALLRLQGAMQKGTTDI